MRRYTDFATGVNVSEEAAASFFYTADGGKRFLRTTRPHATDHNLSIHITEHLEVGTINCCIIPHCAAQCWYVDVNTPSLSAKGTILWCMCDRASYLKMTRGTNLMQQLWIIIINNSTCFGHLYVHLQECRLCTAACGVQDWALWLWS